MMYSPVTINNINVYPFKSVDELLDDVVDEKKILIAINAEKILHATEHTINIINSNIGYADGVGAVFALKKRGYKASVKIPGCELWLKIIERYSGHKSFYLIGGKQKIVDQTVKKLKSQFPQINVVNYKNGYFDEMEKRKLFQDIQEKKPDIIFVAMGSPKQEIVMNEMLSCYPALYMGLGGSFDVYTDNVKRASRWWVERNLEWAYRLVKQPSRIRRQIYLVRFIRFLLFSYYM